VAVMTEGLDLVISLIT